jgi:hypothetical protein
MSTLMYPDMLSSILRHLPSSAAAGRRPAVHFAISELGKRSRISQRLSAWERGDQVRLARPHLSTTTKKSDADVHRLRNVLAEKVSDLGVYLMPLVVFVFLSLRFYTSVPF